MTRRFRLGPLDPIFEGSPSTRGGVATGNTPPGDPTQPVSDDPIVLNVFTHVDISDPGFMWVDTANEVLYVCNDGSNLIVALDISDPLVPVYLDSSATIGDPWRAFLSGSVLFAVSGSSNNLHSLDVSNPASISTLDTEGTSTGPMSVAVSGNYAYTTSTTRISRINISNPSAMSFVNDTFFAGGVTTNSAIAISNSGAIAYIGTTAEFYTYNISNPAVAPVLGTNVSAPALVLAMRVIGNILVMSCAGRVVFYDITTPASPSLLGSLIDSDLATTGTNKSGIGYHGSYLYLPGYNNDRFVVVDWSNPASPTKIASITNSDLDQAYATESLGNYAFVSTSQDKILTIGQA